MPIMGLSLNAPSNVGQTQIQYHPVDLVGNFLQGAEGAYKLQQLQREKQLGDYNVQGIDRTNAQRQAVLEDLDKMTPSVAFMLFAKANGQNPDEATQQTIAAQLEQQKSIVRNLAITDPAKAIETWNNYITGGGLTANKMLDVSNRIGAAQLLPALADAANNLSNDIREISAKGLNFEQLSPELQAKFKSDFDKYNQLYSQYASFSDKDVQKIAQIDQYKLFDQANAILGHQKEIATYQNDAVKSALEAVRPRLNWYISVWRAFTRIKQVVTSGNPFDNVSKFEILGSFSKIMDPNTQSRPEEVAGVGGHALLQQIAQFGVAVVNAVNRAKDGQPIEENMLSLANNIPDQSVIEAIKVTNELVPIINKERKQIINQFTSLIGSTKTTAAANFGGPNLTERTEKQPMVSNPTMEVPSVQIPNRVSLGGALGMSNTPTQPNLNLQLQGLGPNTTIGKMLQGGNNGFNF